MQLPLVLLTRSPEYYTSKRLLEAAHRVGLSAHCVDSGSTKAQAIEALNKHLGKAPWTGLILPRIGSQHTAQELELLTALMERGLWSSSSPQALDIAMDKSATYQRLVTRGLPTPPSRLADSADATIQAARELGPAPWVIKPRRGSQGRDVHRADSVAELKGVAGEVLERNAGLIIQPLVLMQRPRDLRVLVTHGAARAACWRIAAEGEFRSNVHLGAQTRSASLTPYIAQLAEQAAAAIGLSHAGVDLLPTLDFEVNENPPPGSLQILEVNGSPGLEGIERVSQRDLAELVLDDALQSYAQHQAFRPARATSSV